eukprot:7456123-Alexandrium_andersonii.AAC.1
MHINVHECVRVRMRVHVRVRVRVRVHVPVLVPVPVPVCVCARVRVCVPRGAWVLIFKIPGLGSYLRVPDLKIRSEAQ